MAQKMELLQSSDENDRKSAISNPKFNIRHT